MSAQMIASAPPANTTTLRNVEACRIAEVWPRPRLGAMDLGLTGRVALVIGGSQGIGRATAEGLAAEGAKVAVAARSAEGVRAVADETGGRGYVFDSDDLDAIEPLVHPVQQELGPIEVLVLNTGGPPRGENPLGFSVEQWEAAHRTLVISPMMLLERVVP